MQQAEDVERADHYAEALRALFGEKCLPDNVDSSEPNVDSSHGKVESLEPKPAEPKFKVGEKVMYKGVLRVIDSIDTVTHRYHLSNGNYYAEWVDESDLEPYTEPTDTCTDTCTDDGSSPDHFVLYHEMVDDSINDGFREHNRLHIASMAMAGLLANPTVNDYTSLQDAAHIDFIVEDAVTYADALIAKCKKGGIV